MLMHYGRSGCLGFLLVGLATAVQADTIHACASQISGELRVISEGNHCNSWENALAWSTGLGRETTAERTRTPTVSEPRAVSRFSDINLYLE
jgi:hypothetical protein